MAVPVTSLSAAAIAAQRATPVVHPVAIEVVAVTGSTNADLMARAACGQLAGSAAPFLLIAEHQSAGRGRAGRSWLSAPGQSLTFSLAWRFTGGAQRLSGLPLAVGVAVAETLAVLGMPVQLKWPNDVLKDGAKLAGMLIETQQEGSATSTSTSTSTLAVIGIGLNLVMPEALEAQIDRDVASAPWLARMDRNALMAALLDALANTLSQFARDGFAPFAARWNGLHAWAGQAVRIVDQGVTLQQGLAAGVDDSGHLLLDTDAGRVAVHAGDVSLRLDGR